MHLDIRTLIFVIGVTHIIQLVVFSNQFLMNKHYQGIGWWLLWSVAEVMGFAFMLLRQIPSIQTIAIIFQNSMIILGVIFVYIGMMRFFGKKENQRAVFIIFGAFITSLLYFIFIDNDIVLRTVIISITLAAVAFLTVHALFVHRPVSVAVSANFAAAFFLAHGCFFVFRSVMVLSESFNANPFGATPLNVATFLEALASGLLWTFALIVMINQRLNTEMKEAKEEMEMVFNTSPDAALISRMSDGLIIYVNEGFNILSGFSRDETMGKSTLDVNIWKNPEDRQKVVDILLKKDSVDNFEARFQRKDKSLLDGLMSAKIIHLQNIPHVISVTKDITSRKLAEKEREKLILQLKEALINIKTLSGLIPICASCKKIRNDKGFWEQIESYIRDRSDAEFSHGICPECLKKDYPEFDETDE